MKNEYEATYPNQVKSEIRDRLKQAGAKLVRKEFMQKRIVFNLPETPLDNIPAYEIEGKTVCFEDFNLEVDSIDNFEEIVDIITSPEYVLAANKGWLRVRDEGTKITLSYKKVAGKRIEDTFEVQLVINEFESGRKFLQLFGCIQKAYQESLRELWQLESADITIDTWPFLPPFVEVEAEAESIVEDVSKQLGFDYNTAYFGAVDELYAKKYGIDTNIINNETPVIRFNGPNPFE